jgi:SpoVK/Ycf46/Vps4 family AAA+-type ATPase
MLLSGPPGTGKTSVATSIAGALGFRLITVTVSDFLGAGGALVEARAKAIFQMLEAQSKSVILFDEIDAFLLDRDSELYRKQDTLFQFLTPGMLTKINDLHSAERSIFIIATNYANRIDPAIKRAGRIDREYLLLPPDLQKRESIIREALEKHFSTTKKFRQIGEMAKVSLYLGYKEITGVIDRLPKTATDTQVIRKLKYASRSSDLNHYFDRLDKEEFPYKEFTEIAAMALQADVISKVNECIVNLNDEGKAAWGRLMKRSPDLKKDLKRLGVGVS